MERNKWEEEFKSKINQREITPTPHAWDRLDALLNEAESKQESQDEPAVRKLKWLYIAAGFIGFVLVATLFFQNATSDRNNEQIIVEQEKPQEVDTINEMIGPNAVEESQVVVSEKHSDEEEDVPNSNRKTSLPNLNRVKSSQVANVELENQNSRNDNPQHSNTFQNQSTVSPRANVDQQIADIGPAVQKSKTIKVDPSSLLSQVDGELELSFREKVLRSVNKNYQNVKVAVANRNQQ